MQHLPKIIIPIPIPMQVPIKAVNQKAKKEHIPYSEFKSDGKPKAQAADSIRSYDDFSAIQKYFLNTGRENLRVRNWALWTIGVSFGIRASDVCILKIRHLLDTDGSFRPRLKIIEKKTGKLNNILITESVQNALIKYCDSLDKTLDYEDYLFPSAKSKEPLKKEHRWRIFDTVGKKLNLPYNLGAHTMRHSFLSIAASVDKTKIDQNFITKAQYMLNHTDQRTTMRYLKVFEHISDKARIAVSEFLLGRAGINELNPITYQDNSSMQDIISLLEELKDKLPV